MNRRYTFKSLSRGCIAALCVLFCAAALQAQSVSAGKWAQARDSVSEEELQKQVGAAKSMSDQLATWAKPVKESARPSTDNKLYSQSIILFDGSMHTVVPLGAVLHLPPALRSHVVSKATGDFTFWPNFLARNASWLSTKEVSLDMAKGDPKLARKVLQSVAKDTKLLVSVYKGCPISVLEPAPASASASTSASTDGSAKVSK